jgi:uncharacterized protein DUF6151
MKHHFQCRCGALRGEVTSPRKAIRGICYCKDCQTYARALGQSERVLDGCGGTDVVATLGKYVTFTTGLKSLACLSLSEKGLLRWYASCCNTPIANTLRNHRIPYVGLVHVALGSESQITNVFGPVQMQLNISSAADMPNWKANGKLLALVRFLPSLLFGRLDRSYRLSPFFHSTEGTPIVAPRVLSRYEIQQAQLPDS